MTKPTPKVNAPVRSIASRFSEEQLIQIRRLVLSGKFEGRTKEEAADEVIYTLAAAALWTLGLDPLAQDKWDLLSEEVFENEKVDTEIRSSVVNEVRESAGEWTMRQRAREAQAEA